MVGLSAHLIALLAMASPAFAACWWSFKGWPRNTLLCGLITYKGYTSFISSDPHHIHNLLPFLYPHDRSLPSSWCSTSRTWRREPPHELLFRLPVLISWSPHIPRHGHRGSRRRCSSSGSSCSRFHDCGRSKSVVLVPFLHSPFSLE